MPSDSLGSATLVVQLYKLGACYGARLWITGEGASCLEDAWWGCPRGDWLMWLAARVGVDLRTLCAVLLSRREPTQHDEHVTGAICAVKLWIETGTPPSAQDAETLSPEGPPDERWADNVVQIARHGVAPRWETVQLANAVGCGLDDVMCADYVRSRVSFEEVRARFERSVEEV